MGQRRIENVAASIGNISSSLLLGQSFLEKLGTWGIDSQRQVLVLGKGTTSKRDETPYPTPSSPSGETPVGVDISPKTPLRDSLGMRCETLPEKVERFINSYTKIEQGDEDCKYRRIARGDINSDGIEDLIITFSIGGVCGSGNTDKNTTPGSCGNHSETYLKIFLGKELKEVPIKMIGGRGTRSIKGLNVVGGVILAETLEWGKDDSMCCPSIKRFLRACSEVTL